MNFNPPTVILPSHTTHFNRKIMEWTNDDALELIEQYRNHMELWNRADPKYKDKLCRFRAWSEIAERFGCSKAEVERKMNVLLTQYRREKHKMLVKLYQGIQPNPSKWYAFKRFDFMEAGGGSAANTNGHTVAAAAALNGLAAGFETATSATASGSSSATHHHHHHHHRRLKSKEMKYFGAMGLNLPMLIANSQTGHVLDTWNAVGQYSPPQITERSQLRVPLPMSFSATQNELNVANATTHSIFGGGGSSNSNLTASPQKPMETTDIDEKNEAKHERLTPTANTHDDASAAGSLGVVAVGGTVSSGVTAAIAGESGSSPIPNTNTHEAHKNRHDQDALDIKQELVDYFHAPHPPPAPDSHRSYSSNEDNRHGGGGGGGVDSDEYAQDLRISAAAAAAAKSLNFSQFVLPRNLRRSSDSIDEKFLPLNMRKLSSNAGNSTATTAGQMLMNSLLSNESMSEDTTGSHGGRHKSSSQDASTSAAAAAAAAIYADSLNKDDCDFIGSNVTVKLRSMDRTQRIIAEKLISEVLYYGQFDELERTARIQPK